MRGLFSIPSHMSQFVLARAVKAADPTVDADAWAQRLDDAIYHECVEVQQGSETLYRRKVRSIAFNLRNVKRNPRWAREVLSGKIPVEKAVWQTHREMFPEAYYDADQACYEREQRSHTKDDTRTDAGQPCGKCHSRNTTYTLMQTRRADEGSTEYWYCRDCGKRWKGGG